MMAKLHVDANPKFVAYVLEGSNMAGSGYTEIATGHTNMEAEYMGVIYGLNQYFLAWNKELDSRQDDYDIEASKAKGEPTFAHVATPSQRTKRPLPDPVLVLSDNEVVVKQLSRQYHINNDKLRKLAQQIWQMAQNIEVKYQWISRKENLAGKMLP